MNATESGSRRAADEVLEIEVVCTGNIARSPFAAALLEAEARARLGAAVPVWVRSSGVHGWDGRPAVEGMRREAAARGLDLSRHRSSPTRAAEVQRAHLVLTMTEAQRQAVAGMAPGAAERAFTLREVARLLDAVAPPHPEGTPVARVVAVIGAAHRARARVPAPPGPEDVLDPYGGSGAAYARTAAELTDLVMRVAERLFGPRSGQAA